MHLKKEYIISKQIIRSGTAVGALTREAEFAQSKADFINKLSISVKEANETMFWLELLFEVKRISEELYKELSSFCNEIISILVASIKTAKNNAK